MSVCMFMRSKDRTIMQLDDLVVYQHAIVLGEHVWSFVYEWSALPRDTIGKQLIRSADSIAANIAEGFGRFSYRENRQFCYYSRGSLYETKTWLCKAYNRRLIAPQVYSALQNDIDTLARLLNSYTSSIGKSSSKRPPLTIDQ